IPSAMDKIRLLDRIRREKDLHFAIEIDGGVNLKNAADIKAAGCDILVAGSAVFGADDIPARVREFQAVLA
ncbi:MAG: ribulose-phosphate 3-epimerase, partial [Firmicutes bacterium]|nr:ribulose-phosphate 3-epimerase [Bacillota bacterium]